MKFFKTESKESIRPFVFTSWSFETADARTTSRLTAAHADRRRRHHLTPVESEVSSFLAGGGYQPFVKEALLGFDISLGEEDLCGEPCLDSMSIME